MPRKKDQGTPQAKGSVPGDNGDPSVEETKRAYFLSALAKLQDLNSKMETLRGQARNVRKEAKAAFGLEKFEFDYAIRLRRNDEEEMIEQRRREQRIAVWLSHPVGMQADLFADGPPAGGNGRIHDLGLRAGAEGAVCKPPSNLSQDDAQRWITGWHAGQAAMARQGIRAPDVEPDFQ